jgi:hypothetical protein
MRTTNLFTFRNILLILFFFGCWHQSVRAGGQPPPATSSPVEFYRSLASAVSTAQGHLLLDMNGGKYKITLVISGQSRELRINVNRDTVMESNFNYRNQALISTNIVFTPEIHLYLVGAEGFSCKLKSLEYNSNGGIVGSDCRIDNPDATGQPGNFANINRHLELSTRSEDMFLGSPFANAERLRSCNEVFTGCVVGGRTFFNRVRFLRSEESPALLVTLKGGSTIYLNKTRTNFVTLDADSGFEFQDLTYELDGGFLKGFLNRFDLSIRRGDINSGTAFLRFRNGSRLNLNQVRFSRDRTTGEALINAEYGSISASIGQGSSVAFTNGIANASSLLLNDGTGVELVGFRYQVDDQRSTMISVGNGSTLTAKIMGGRLALGTRGFVQLENGDFELDLQGIWQTGARPDVTGTVRSMNVAFSSGELDLNAGSHLRLASGRIVAQADPNQGIPGLVINSRTTPAVTGQFKSVNFTIAENSTFQLPANLILTTKQGGTLSAADPAKPIRIEDGVPFPTGQFTLNIPFKRLANSSAATFALTDGEITLPLENTREGTIKNIENKFIEFAGTLTLEVPHAGVATTRVSVTEGIVDISPSNSSFKGVWSATIPTGIGTNIKTPFMSNIDIDGDGERNNDARIFPLHLHISLAENIPIRNVPIEFRNNVVTTEVALEPVLNLQIKEGGGEYNDKDNPDAGTKGGDGFANWQEVFRDDFLTSTVHFYLEPRNYRISSKMNVSMKASGLQVSISEIRMNDTISWKKNGGDIAEILKFAGGFASAVLSSNPLPGIIIGGIVGDRVEDRLAAIINHRIAERIHNMRLEWRVRT